jgi:hypothetical protein
MRTGATNTSDNKEYFSSNRWKCEKSPSGAHFWIIVAYEMTCKYCNNNKSLSTNAVAGVNLKQMVIYNEVLSKNNGSTGII